MSNDGINVVNTNENNSETPSGTDTNNKDNNQVKGNASVPPFQHLYTEGVLSFDKAMKDKEFKKYYGLHQRDGHEGLAWTKEHLLSWIRLWESRIPSVDRETFSIPYIQDIIVSAGSLIGVGMSLVCYIGIGDWEAVKSEIKPQWWENNKVLFGLCLDKDNRPIKNPFADLTKKRPLPVTISPLKKQRTEDLGTSIFDEIKEPEEKKSDDVKNIIKSMHEWIHLTWEELKIKHKKDTTMAVLMLLAIILPQRRVAWILFLVLANADFAFKVFNVLTELDTADALPSLLVSLNPLLARFGLLWEKEMDGLYDIFNKNNSLGSRIVLFIQKFKPLPGKINLNKRSYVIGGKVGRTGLAELIKIIAQECLLQGGCIVRRCQFIKKFKELISREGYWKKKVKKLSKEEVRNILAQKHTWGMWLFIKRKIYFISIKVARESLGNFIYYLMFYLFIY